MVKKRAKTPQTKKYLSSFFILLDDFNSSYFYDREDQEAIEDNPMSQDVSNCSETVQNVTLVATSLRRNHTYVLVIYYQLSFLGQARLHLQC